MSHLDYGLFYLIFQSKVPDEIFGFVLFLYPYPNKYIVGALVPFWGHKCMNTCLLFERPIPSLKFLFILSLYRTRT